VAVWLPSEKMNFFYRTISALKAGLRSISPTCRDASRLQSEALDHPLSPARRLGLWLHLLICKWCRRYGKQIHFLHHAAHTHPEALTEAVPQKLSLEARERIKQRLQNEK
jgi:hypothetical protein